MSNGVKIRKYDYVEFYVGSAKATAYWFAKALSMDITGYLGPETGVRDRVSYYLTKNDLQFVITSAVQPGTWDVLGFVNLHGDGVKRWAVEVDDVDAAFPIPHGVHHAGAHRVCCRALPRGQGCATQPDRRHSSPVRHP